MLLPDLSSKVGINKDDDNDDDDDDEEEDDDDEDDDDGEILVKLVFF